MNKRSQGFTLVEILLVSALVAVVGVAIFNAFANGAKLWSKAKAMALRGDAAIFFDHMAQDLRGAQTISSLKFKGMTLQMSVPTIVLTQADSRSSRMAEEMVDQIGMAQYYFEPAEKRIYRRQANYSQALKGLWQTPTVIVGQVEEVAFKYYVMTDRGLEAKEQATDVIPFAVMVDLGFKENGVTQHTHQYIPIPTGGAL